MGGNKNNAVTGLFLIVYGIIDPVATGGCVRTGEIENVRNQNHNQRLDRLDRREGQRRALVSHKAAASTALKRLKSGDAYSWNCEAVVSEFPGWGKK